MYIYNHVATSVLGCSHRKIQCLPYDCFCNSDSHLLCNFIITAFKPYRSEMTL